MAGMVRRVNAVRTKKRFALACRAMGEGLRGLKKVDADEIAEAQVRMQVICRTILRSGSWRDRSAVPQQRRRRPRTPGRLCLLRSEEHTSELQSLMRISYAVFCLKKKTQESRSKKSEEYTIESTTT